MHPCLQKLHDISAITTTNGKVSPLEFNKKDFRQCAEYYLRAADGDCLSAMNALGAQSYLLYLPVTYI